ncbi:MAG TPA: 30S ribosomal protein S8 [Thermoanaerobaculia bacterium]|jgi:small subunit ribosomal protein S8|nr:30S ribosomal protein S8 [Thermoanaerobaculia bacterium]
MSMTDPIADLLARIRNAHLAKHDRLDIPASRMKENLCKILEDEGFIRSVKRLREEGALNDTLRIYLRYSNDGQPAINHVERLSKPGRRLYMGADEITEVRNGLGMAIVSTSQGLLSDKQARERRVGGELLCRLW